MAQDSSPWLLVGLGNPGPDYERNRHNVGFLALDAFVSELRLGSYSKKHKGELASGEAFGQKVYALKPMTFMNLSGDSVARAASFFSVPLAHTVVLHDEVDIDFAKLRLKQGGGAGGHNGLRSITAQLGAGDYLRLRIGIGRHTPKGDVTPHVLGDFSRSERDLLERDVFPRCIRTLETLLRRGLSAAMNECNTDPKPEKAKDPTRG
jgi:PTH1 family peptidyl-tRNA hydrolase